MRAMPRRAHCLLVILLAVLAFGCYRVPEGKSAVSEVNIVGTHDLDEDELEEKIATRESPRFLGLFSGVVYEYETFDRYALRRDLLRIERTLRARGYYEARVYAARIIEKGDKVEVTIEVEQGEPVRIESIGVRHDGSVDPKAEEALRARVSSLLPVGAILDEDKFEEAEGAALRGLTSNGHAAAKVARHAEVDLATHQARLTFEVAAGPKVKLGPITFENLGELPEDMVRRVFGLEEGQDFSSEEIDDARQGLLDLGVFATVDVEQDLSTVETTKKVPLVIKCEVAKIRGVLVGMGAELDQLKTDVHLQFGWQNANFLGNLRNFEVRYKPGVVLYPTRFSTDEIQPPEKPLYEHRLQSTLRQPAFFEKRLVGLGRAEYHVYPVLLGKPTENVLGYHELRGEVGLERKFWNTTSPFETGLQKPLRRLFVSPDYGLQANFPFDYIGQVPQVETLIVSYIAVQTFLDFRNDPIKPRRGIYVGNDLQLAGGPLQGDATDIRTQPEVRAYFALPKKITLALRGSVGFLFPRNYAQLSQINFANPGPSRLEAAARDYQLLFFRGFFGGGPTSNRGYPLRGIGPHDYIPYLSPAGQFASGGCNPNDERCELPTGGLTLWETNVELRFVIAGPAAAAIFCDAGDVSPFELDIRLNRPHLSCGAGGRYDTPVGPIRLDIGYRIPGMQTPGITDQFEREPDRIFGIPIAVAFGIGEAF